MAQAGGGKDKKQGTNKYYKIEREGNSKPPLDTKFA
jgi:hypothetical protein